MAFIKSYYSYIIPNPAGFQKILHPRQQTLSNKMDFSANQDTVATKDPKWKPEKIIIR